MHNKKKEISDQNEVCDKQSSYYFLNSYFSWNIGIVKFQKERKMFKDIILKMF